MSASSYYDVVVLGTRLGGLLSGALLAKRGFRVLLLGQDDLPPTYAIEGRTLPRAPHTFLPTQGPVVKKTLSELALYQMFRRRTLPAEPGLQVVLPGHRLDLGPDPAGTMRELEREFPEVRRPVEDLLRSVRRVSAQIDRLTERDLVWPPETFLERREFARAMDGLPFDRAGEGWNPLAELPEDHPFGTVVRAPIRFATDLDPEQMPSLGVVRLYASLLDDSRQLEGGYEWLRNALLEKVDTYSGEVRHRERADQLILRRGAVSGVRLAGTGEEVACSFVLCGSPIDQLLRLTSDRSPFEEIFERMGEPMPRWYRYTVNVVVEDAGMPEGMGRDVYFLRDASRPPFGENLLWVQAYPTDTEGHRLLCVQTLLSRRSVEDVADYMTRARERVLSGLGELIPFLGRHVLLVDSPHDGRHVQNLRDRTVVAPAEPWTRGPTTMEAVYGYPVRGTLGVCALPVRTPLRRLLLCNEQVAPGLGMEGVFLAAWSAARLVTRADHRKEWMRRGLWTKVEL